jgi:hypothetical protein
LTFVAVRNLSLPRGPSTFLNFQTSPPDPFPSLLPPRARALPCSAQSCSATGSASPPAAAVQAVAVHLLLPFHPRVILFPSQSCSSSLVASRARHGFPERPPAATSSSSWKAHRRALNLYLSRALAPHQPLRPIPPEPLAFLELPIHIPPPPFLFCSGNARHHRGQHDSSVSTPSRFPSQHHIITPELYDHSVESLVPYIPLPTLAGVCRRRRHPCLHRSSLI